MYEKLELKIIITIKFKKNILNKMNYIFNIYTIEFYVVICGEYFHKWFCLLKIKKFLELM
jgi:hypothetical protein